MTGPPRLALWLVERSLGRHERDAVLGDLLEEFETMAARDEKGAQRWIWSQVLRSMVPNLRRLASNRSLIVQPERGARDMSGFAADLRFSLRLLRRQPMMTVVALLSLSAGLGLNLLLFTIANGVLLRPLPLSGPGRLVVLLSQRESGLNHNFSYPTYVDMRDASQTLAALVAYSQAEATAAGLRGSEPLQGEVVSGNFFAALGVPMRAGRGLLPDDDRPAAPPAAVVSARLWSDRFGNSPISGQTITLNGDSYTIVGVTSESFRGMQVGSSSAFWVPLAKSASIAGGDYLARSSTSWLTLVGRMGPASEVDAVRTELDTISRRAFESQRQPVEPIVLRPGARGDSLLPEQLASPLWILMAAGALVLIISCVNVANMQLARAEARRLELAVRAALGASRTQLLRLMVLDGALLACAAAGGGLGLTALLKDDAASLIALYGTPVTLSTPIDWRVMTACLALTAFAATVIALVSTWRLLRNRPAAGLGDGRSVAGGRHSLDRSLVIAQFALSMALLTGAGLLVRTLAHLRATDLGYDSRGVALVAVSPEMARLSPQHALRYFDETIRAVAGLPGVEQAAVAHVMPLDFGGSRTSIGVAGYSPAAGEDMELNFVRVTPGYFTTLRIPLRQGRFFDARDADGQPLRIIVNETMARRFWPDGHAVGRFVRLDSRGPYTVEVVGIVPDVHYRMVREEASASFYVPMAQMPTDRGVIHVRIGPDPATRLEELRRTIAAVDPSVPVTRAHTLRQQVERNIADERMAGAIGTVLAGVALVLATAGLNATMAFVVGRRTREIGVRIALGARTADVRWMVLGEGLKLVTAGLGAGLALALWLGHALRYQLYGIREFDTVSLAGAAFVLALAALVASWVPARRAARIDPVVALRES